MAAAEVKKKTPSPKVIAAKWLAKQLCVKEYAVTLIPEALTELADSRVNEAKADKVIEQIEKVSGKLVERLNKIIDPPAKKKPAKKK